MVEYKNNIYLEEKLNTRTIGLTVPQGDTESALITLTSNFEAVDLTNKIVMCYVTNKLNVGTENPATITISATVENALEGEVSINIGEIITSAVGDYVLEVVVSGDPLLQAQTFPSAILRVPRVTRQLQS